MYEIPKLQVPIVLSLVNDESIPGKMFMTEDRVSPGGNAEIAEFLNHEADDFFSFLSDAGAYRLVNRRQVLYIETEQDDREIRKQTPLTPKSLVLHFANDRSFYGVVYPTLAEETRVSDILNQEGSFFTIYRRGTQFVVNRTLIVYANAN